jgi:hypothetical protein
MLGRIRIVVLLAIVALVWFTAPQPARASFDELAPSPRARALGQSMSATANDAWAYYYNPAMLPRLGGLHGGVATLRPNGLSYNRLTSLAAATSIPGRGGVAFGWRRYGVEHAGVDLTTENTLSFSHGFTLFRDASTSASVGWTLNLFHLEFAETVTGVDPGSAWAYGFDVGGLVSVYERTRVGFFVRNLNNPTIGDDAEELEQVVRVGLAYEPYPGVTTSFDVQNGLRSELRALGGFEMEIVPALELRVGLETQPSKVTGGFAVNLPKVSVDYGFSTGGGVLDSSHHLGLSTKLDIFGEAK